MRAVMIIFGSEVSSWRCRHRDHFIWLCSRSQLLTGWCCSVSKPYRQGLFCGKLKNLLPLSAVEVTFLQIQAVMKPSGASSSLAKSQGRTVRKEAKKWGNRIVCHSQFHHQTSQKRISLSGTLKLSVGLFWSQVPDAEWKFTDVDRILMFCAIALHKDLYQFMPDEDPTQNHIHIINISS